MNEYVDKFESKNNNSLKESINIKQSIAKKTGQFIDNRPNVIAQRKLKEIAINNAKSKKEAILRAKSFNEEKEVKQLIKINGRPLTFNEILPLIEQELPKLEGKQKGTFAKIIFKDSKDFKTEGEAIAYIRIKGTEYIEAVGNAGAVKDRGDATETAAAQIIGGQVNRGGNGRDVEWRMITRNLAEAIKNSAKINSGPDTDQELFENWKKIIKKLPEGEFDIETIRKVGSTPTDAFSSSIIAIAGGPIKFKEGTNTLKVSAANRVRELITLAGLLKYKPVLVFSATVTCEQCDAVASKFGIDVIHLE